MTDHARQELFVPSSSKDVRGTVLFLHGLTGSPQEGAGLAEFLSARGYQTLAPLLPGHEKSVKELAKTSASKWLSAIAEAADKAATQGAPVSIVGLSLGALLALSLLAKFPQRFQCGVALSPPLILRSAFNERLLTLFSLAPDPILSRLWYSKKSSKRYETLLLPRETFDSHSVGAAAHLVKIRRAVIRSLGNIQAPVLFMQDQQDHYVHEKALRCLEEHLPLKKFEIVNIPGGAHQLLHGPEYKTVYEKIAEFFERVERTAHAS